MRRIIMLSKMFSVTFTILLIAGIVWEMMQSPSSEHTVVTNTQTETSESVQIGEKTNDEAEITETAEENPTEEVKETKKKITQLDIEKQETRLELLQTRLDEVQPQLVFYQSLPESLSDEDVHEIAQKRILQCYEENVVLAVEIKAVLMDSLGVSLPSGFSSNSAADDYVEYLKEDVVGGIVDQIASEPVQDAVKNGIDGAIEAYEAEGSLGAALSGAVNSVADGVIAQIQDAPYELAKGILDETTMGLFSVAEGLANSDSPEDFLKNMADEKTGGLIGSIGSIVNYEDSPTTYFQSLSRSASVSAAELKGFLEMEKVNSDDIANMMYRYSQFGETLSDVKTYDWKGYYDSMEVLYGQFVRNEIMIEILSGEASYE